MHIGTGGGALKEPPPLLRGANAPVQAVELPTIVGILLLKLLADAVELLTTCDNWRTAVAWLHSNGHAHERNIRSTRSGRLHSPPPVCLPRAAQRNSRGRLWRGAWEQSHRRAAAVGVDPPRRGRAPRAPRRWDGSPSRPRNRHCCSRVYGPLASRCPASTGSESCSRPSPARASSTCACPSLSTLNGALRFLAARFSPLLVPRATLNVETARARGPPAKAHRTVFSV